MSSFIINQSNLSLEASELALDGAWGMLHSYMTSPLPLEIEKRKDKLLIASKDTPPYGESDGAETRDLEEEQEEMRANLQFCTDVNRIFGESSQAYYQRIATAYNDILKSRLTKSYATLKPSCNIFDLSRPMREIATSSWKIKELPGRSPLTQWPESLNDLNERLLSLEAMAAWSEPIADATITKRNTPGNDSLEIGDKNTNQDMYSQAEEFIKKTMKKKQDLLGRNDKNQLASIDRTQATAISALIGLSVLSGDFTKILSTLSILYDISENYPEVDNMIGQIQDTMIHYVNKLKFLHKETKSYHHLANGSMYGCIPLPKEASADYQSDATSSLTTDGTYLYIYWCSGRGGLFKIGTGEGNSLAGKVYLQTKSELNGEVAWVYLKNKIYARRVDEPLGVLHVISPDTFLIEENISLHCDEKDLMTNAAAAKFNKYYPLLTDGNYLYIIIMKVATRERQLKEIHKEEVEELKAQEKKTEKKGKTKEAKPDSTEPSAPKKLVKPVGVAKADLYDLSSKPYVESTDQNANKPADSLYKAIEDLKEAKICEFYLLEFDTDTSKYQHDEKTYKNNPDVQELYQSFSCYFSYEECYRALKMNADDIELAASWLVEEGNQDCQNTLISRRKVLLCQSEVISDNVNKMNEHDIQVKDDSLLFPLDIMDSPWTLSNGQLALNKYFRNELDTKVFSIYEKDVKVHSNGKDNDEEVDEELKFKTPEEKKKQLTTSIYKKAMKKPGGGLFGGDSDESEVDEGMASPDLKRGNNNPPPQETPDTVDIYKKALKMYEKLTLEGSFINSVKDTKIIDYSMDLSYDHKYGKFYGLVSSQNAKGVLVAQDMTQMRDAVFTHEEDIDFIGIPEDKTKVTLKYLIQKTLEFFLHFERIRFDLPWRWRRWSTVFSSANDSFGTKDSKVIKRYEKVRHWELNSWRMKFGLEQIAIPKKNKNNPGKAKHPPNPYSTDAYRSNDDFKEIPVRIEERKMNAFCVSGDIESLRLLFSMIKLSYSKLNQQMILKAYKHIQNDQSKYSINTKYRGLLTNTQVMQKLLEDLIKEFGHEHEMIIACNEYVLLTMLIQQLIYWVRTSDTLVASPTEGDPELLTEVGEFLLEASKIKDDKILEGMEEHYRLLWVAMINGFEIFYRSTESQFTFIRALLKDSFRFKRLSSSSAKRDASVGYHYYLDSINPNISPLQLFFICHFKYPQTFLFRAPLVCSEIKEYSIKFKLKEGEEKAKTAFTSPFTAKFSQKAPQFYSLVTNGGILENCLNEIQKDYDKVCKEYSKVLHLESISETQTCSSVSQKDYTAPFKCFFAIDQKLDFTSNNEEKNKSKKGSKAKNSETHDEEVELSEDYAVDLFLSLYQNKPIDQLLKDLPEEEVKQDSSPANKKKKKNKGKNKEAKKETLDEKAKKEEEDKIKKEKLQKKRAFLRDLHSREQELHAERVNVLWVEFTELLLKQREQAKKHGGVDSSTADAQTKEILYSLNSIRYLWKIFNRIVEDCLAIKHSAFHNVEKNREFLYKTIEFAEKCIAEFSVDDFNSFNGYEWKWMRCFYKYFQIVTTQAVMELDQIDFANKVLPTYMKVIGMLTRFLGVTETENELKESIEKLSREKIYSNDYSVCGSPFTYLVGGVDYTNEKIFETPHPYPRGEVSVKETYYFPKAIAVQIRFDPLCQSDPSNCVLQILANDHSYWFNDNFGTLFRCSGKPHQRNPIILMPGSRVTVEFKATAQGSRRKAADLHGDQYYERYGYKIAVNAIYAETSLSCSDSSPSNYKKNKNQKAKTSKVIGWITILNSLVNSSSVMSQALVKGTEGETVENPAADLSLLKGGFSTSTLEDVSFNPLAEYYQSVKKGEGMAFDVCNIIRKHAPPFETKLPPVLAQKFTKEMIERWNYVQNLAMICLMYHSDTIEDVFYFSQDQDDPDSQKTLEIVKVVWHYTLGISKWMQSSLQGEKEAQICIKESCNIAQKLRDERVQELQKQRDEAKAKELVAKKEREEKEKMQLEAIKEQVKEEDKEAEAKAGKKLAASSTNKKVAVSKVINRSKKQNRKKLLNQMTIPKNKKKSKGKKHTEEVVEEEKKEEKEEDNKEEEKEEPKEPELLNDQQLMRLCTDIYEAVYLNIATKLQEATKLQIMCNRFHIVYDANDQKKCIKKVTKKILKEKVIKYIDIKDPKQIKDNEKFELKAINPPELVIMKEVEDKLLFLLELNQSVDLISQILETEKNSNLIGRLKSNKDINIPKSFEGKNADHTSDSDMAIQRSKSEIVKPADIANQLVRNKSKKGMKVSKFTHGGATPKKKENLEKQHSTSTFEAVLDFIKFSSKDVDLSCGVGSTDESKKEDNIEEVKGDPQEENKSDSHKSEDLALMKQKMKSQILDKTYGIADNRINGLKYYNKLLSIITETNQSRSIVLPLACGIEDNPFVEIEASGVERLRKMNNGIKETLRHCFRLFVRDYSRLKYTVNELLKTKTAAPKSSKKGPQASRAVTKSTTSDELIVVGQIRSIIEGLNDMIVALSNNPAKDAFILHIVFEFQTGDINFSTFIENLINLILDTKDSFILLYKSHISDKLIMKTYIAAKLLLDRFLIKEAEESQLSTDAHLLLQETMLEIIINMLRLEIASERLTTKHQRLVTLFVLMKEVLNMKSSQKELKEDLKESCLDLVCKCITSKEDSSSEDLHQDETNYSNRVIKAACNVARLCLDKTNIIKPLDHNQTFLEMMLKKIGQCVTVSDSRAKATIDKFILCPEFKVEDPKIEDNKDDEASKDDCTVIQPKEEDEKKDNLKEEDAKISEHKEGEDDEDQSSEDTYFVYASINNSSDDCSFLVTASYECDKLLNKSGKKKEKETPQKSKPKEDQKSKEESPKKKAEKGETKSDSAVATKAENNTYYQNLVKLIQYAMEVERSMKSKGTTKIAIKSNMTLPEAQKVCEIFYKAYEGTLSSLNISTETVNALKHPKLLNGIDVSQIYPELCNKNETGGIKAAPQPGQGPLIKLSRDQLQMTICKNVPGLALKLDSATKKLINQRKFCIDNNSRKLVRTGYSSASIINHLKTLIRELLFSDADSQLNLNDQIFNEMLSILKNTCKHIIDDSLDSLDAEQVNLLFGSLETVAGLINIVQPGSEVKVNLSGKECTGTVVDGGHYSGKTDLSVIIDNEDTVTRIPQSQSKDGGFEAYEKIKWNPDLLPDQALINEAVVACFKKLKESKPDEKSLKPYSYSLILLLLQKICLLNNKGDAKIDNLETIEPFFDIIEQYHSKAFDIPSDDCEIKLCEAWKSIVDKLEPELNTHYTMMPKSSKTTHQIFLDNDRPVINEYTLPRSGYDQLPRPKPKANESMAAIRLLAYWEKNIIPKIIEFVKSTYKPWEMEFYFEQLRFHLRHGDQSKALDEALIMCEKKMPGGCVIPDDSYDWSAKMPEECVVGNWFLVRLPELKDTFGTEEIAIVLKAIDLEAKIGLAEYIDKGSVKYNMWIPLKYMYDLPIPLDIPSVCYGFDILTDNYEKLVMAANAYYAKKIIIDHYTKKGSISSALSDKSGDISRVKNIISWITFNDYSQIPVTGVQNVYRHLEIDSKKVEYDSMLQRKLERKDLAELVQFCANNLSNSDSNSEQVTSSHQKLIEDEIVSIIQSGNQEAISQLLQWVKTEWENLSTNLQIQRINIDICREYANFAGIENSSIVTPEGQEVIECRDKTLLLPLHELFAEEIRNKINVGMVVSFDKSEYFRCSTATVKFYSDERGANLISEISAASEQGTQIRPLLFNHGKVWCMFDAGTSAILPKHMQNNVTSSLKCTVALIPYEWTSCCCVTGYMSNALLQMKSEQAVNLIENLSDFFKNSGSPASMNCIIFGLLNKLIQNYRTLKLNEDDSGSGDISPEEHFKRIHVDKNMIQSMITEVHYLKSNQSDLTGNQTLYSFYLQIQIELIVGTLLPTSRYEKINSISDLLEMPNWLENIASAALILANLESPKNQLSTAIENSIYEGTQISFLSSDSAVHSQWERVMIISKLPQEFTRDQIKDTLTKIVNLHRGSIADISIPYDPDFETNKQELLKKFEDAQSAMIKHKDIVKDIQNQITEFIKQEADKRKSRKRASSRKSNMSKSTVSRQDTEQKNEEQKTIEVEEDMKEAEGDQETAETPLTPMTPFTPFTPLEAGEDEKQPEPIDISLYNHQGAAIIVLEQFNLDLLTDADLIEEVTEEEAKEEEVVIPPELNIYNCPACTLENPMTNETCAICGTPRPPDAGQKPDNNDGNDKKDEEDKDPMTYIDQRYDLAIQNRLKYMTDDFKTIITELEKQESKMLEERKAEIDKLNKKFDDIKAEADKRSHKRDDKKQDSPSVGKVQLTKELKEVEPMHLGKLFDDQVEGEGASAPEVSKEQENVKEEENKEEEKQEEQPKEEQPKEEQSKEEQSKEEQSKEEEVKTESREQIKVFFGTTIDDDFKSELYLAEYLRRKLLSEDSKLTDQAKAALDDIYKDDKEASDFKNFEAIAKDEPLRAWKILQQNGYDLKLRSVVYKTLKQANESKLAKNDFNKYVKLVTLDICKESILSPSFRCEEIMARDNLEQFYKEIRYLWSLIRFLNRQLYNSIYLIYCSDATSRGHDMGDTFSLSRLLSKFRIIIHSVKFDLKLTVLDKTSIDREKAPELVFERLKIAHFKNEKDEDAIEVESLTSTTTEDEKNESKEEEEEAHSSLLYSSYEQMNKLDVTLLRPKRPQGAEPHLSFSVVFRGEYVVGEGGPYRQFFADLSSEIQPQSAILREQGESGDADKIEEVSILCPSPNNLGDVTDFKEYFVITPSCVTTTDLALYEYLGILMGVCIRTNVHLTLDLASICWKPLVGEDITLEDLHEIDIGFINRCNYILSCPEDQFGDTIFETFAVNLSDGSLLELCEGGKDIQVTFKNKNEFILKAISARVSEAHMQCKAIKSGISKIIPEGLLNLMTVDELREAVCGKAKCDLELLKRNTKYGGSDPNELEKSELVKWLWEVLEEMSEDDKLKFIVFCWGQERLPANDEEFKYSKTRFMIKPSTNQNYGDGALPKANTCFFNFELPNYSSKQILKEKLLLAIHTDNRSMNAEQQELMEHQGRNDMLDDDY